MSLPKTHKVTLAKKISVSPDGIEYAEVDTPQVTDSHDVIVRNKYAGVNFIDAYFRTGLYQTTFPHIFGREVAGVVAAIGDQVTAYRVGDKVAYISPKTFAQYTKISDAAVHVKKLCSDATDEDLKRWAAILLQGLTAITLSLECCQVQKDDFVLVWAAAGGVGQILTQYTSSLGARVIAIASSDEKLQVAKTLGAEFLIDSNADVSAQVAQNTKEKGVRVCFDSVRKDSFEASLASLGRKGTLVSFGNASGPVLPFNIGRLEAKSLNITKRQLLATLHTKEEWDKYTDKLEEALEKGTIEVFIHKTYPLSEYAQAMKELEGRQTRDKLVLIIP